MKLINDYQITRGKADTVGRWLRGVSLEEALEDFILDSGAVVMVTTSAPHQLTVLQKTPDGNIMVNKQEV